MPGITFKIKCELSFIRGNMLVIIITYSINHFVNAMHGPFKSLYFRELGASPLLIGLMSSVGFIISALIRIPGAHIVDKHGRKKIMVIFTYCAAFSLLIFAFAPDWRFHSPRIFLDRHQPPGAAGHLQDAPAAVGFQEACQCVEQPPVVEDAGVDPVVEPGEVRVQLVLRILGSRNILGECNRPFQPR